MIHYFVGVDTYAAWEEIHNITQKAHATIRWVDRAILEQSSFKDIISESASSLFGVRIPVVRNPSLLPRAFQEQILEVANNLSHTEIILWDEGEPDHTSILYKGLKSGARVFSVPSKDELAAWLMSEVKNRHGTLDRKAAEELVDYAGTNRWRLINELERLFLMNPSISRDSVQEHVLPEHRSPHIFAMLDALADGNHKKAFSFMEQLLEGGENELYILSMLGYHMKTLILIRTGHTSAMHSFVVSKNRQSANRFSEVQLQGMFARVLATDFAIKQGRVDARTGLVMLLVSLTDVEKTTARAVV